MTFDSEGTKKEMPNGVNPRVSSSSFGRSNSTIHAHPGKSVFPFIEPKHESSAVLSGVIVDRRELSSSTPQTEMTTTPCNKKKKKNRKSQKTQICKTEENVGPFDDEWDENDEFLDFIVKLLAKTKVGLECTEHFKTCYRRERGRDMFRIAFTSPSVDRENNYEVFEQIGDAIIGKFLVQYSYMRFPLLKNTRGPGIVAKIKIKYGSKTFLSAMTEKMNLTRFIRCSRQESVNKRQMILDDIFESFVGCLEYFIDQKCEFGIGKAHFIVFSVLAYLFDQEPISLKFEELNDPKTRLKQLFDEFPKQLGTQPIYEFSSADVLFLDNRDKNVICNFLFSKCPEEMMNREQQVSDLHAHCNCGQCIGNSKSNGFQTHRREQFVKCSSSSLSSSETKSEKKKRIFFVSVSSKREIIGKGCGETKKEAQEMASSQALKFLKTKFGFENRIPEQYHLFPSVMRCF